MRWSLAMPCTHLSNSPHLSLSDWFFRLFTIDNLDEDSRLTATLLEGVTSHEVNHDAISYTWDDEKSSVSVTCTIGKGNKILIASSLHAFLCHLCTIAPGLGRPL